MAALAVSWRSPFLGVWDDEMVSREGGGAAAAAVVGEGEKVASSCFPFCRGKHYFYSLSRLKLAYVPLLCSFCSSDCYNLNQMLWYWWLQCCYNCRYCCTGYSCTALTASVSMMLLSKLVLLLLLMSSLSRVGWGSGCCRCPRPVLSLPSSFSSSSPCLLLGGVGGVEAMASASTSTTAAAAAAAPVVARAKMAATPAEDKTAGGFPNRSPGLGKSRRILFPAGFFLVSGTVLSSTS